MADEKSLEEQVLTSLEIDTIGEILNISMGSAATAVSTMLGKAVNISTPTVEVRSFSSMDYAALEPAVLVKINYVEGLSGANVIIFRQRDMQVILNLLMGNNEPPSDDFVFDELSMSAACEVMNQMMGASATALSEFLGMVVNISTPEASVVDSNSTYREAVGVQEGDEIVAVSFQMNIDDVMDTNFASIMECGLAKEMLQKVMGDTPMEPEPLPAPAPAPVPEVPQSPAYPAQPAAPVPQAPPAPPAAPAVPPQAPPPGYPPEAAQGQYPGYPPYYGGYPGYPPYPYPQQPGYPPQGQQPQQPVYHQPPLNVQNTQFPQFSVQGSPNPNLNGNMDLLMGVSLDVSVEIGSAKRKIKEVLEFGQGTVIELNKQAGAPVDIVVNGRLLARGDVVVIDDNFGVRITEILGTRELLESLKEENL
ncbi:MAG: flagellar motor switch phosphatase FliY [Angelakisella sp.]|jgi:flagellar motor switch protein FliN/FliY|nr:flagellar motor switch phosphatase FliY [Angelakisella sp.]